MQELKKGFSVLLLTLMSFLISCKKNPQAEATFFLTSDPIKLQTDGTQGSTSHAITDLYLYVNGQFQGAYPVGHSMPIINKNASTRIDVFAGIRNNGIGDTRTPWLFYQKIQFDTLIPSLAHITRPFTFEYNPSVNFSWLEDFESAAGVSIIKSPISEVGYSVSSPETSFEGKSIEMELSASQIIGQLESTKSYVLPFGNPNVYLELNYKSNTTFEVGVLATGISEKPALKINARDYWNKIYIQLAGVVNAEPKASAYKIYFRMTNTTGVAPKLYLDNIKLLYL